MTAETRTQALETTLEVLRGAESALAGMGYSHLAKRLEWLIEDLELERENETEVAR